MIEGLILSTIRWRKYEKNDLGKRGFGSSCSLGCSLKAYIPCTRVMKVKCGVEWLEGGYMEKKSTMRGCLMILKGKPLSFVFVRDPVVFSAYR